MTILSKTDSTKKDLLHIFIPKISDLLTINQINKMNQP